MANFSAADRSRGRSRHREAVCDGGEWTPKVRNVGQRAGSTQRHGTHASAPFRENGRHHLKKSHRADACHGAARSARGFSAGSRYLKAPWTFFKPSGQSVPATRSAQVEARSPWLISWLSRCAFGANKVGAVAPLQGKPGYYEFEYAPAFVRSGVLQRQIKMPPSIGTRYSFPLSLDTYRGMPGLIADSLPDRIRQRIDR